MARGGARAGAGRKKGETYHTKARKEAARQAVKEATAEGELPLAYMLRVMRDKTADQKRRDMMAQAAASFIHPRLSNATVTTTVKRSVDELTTAELLALLNETADREGTSQTQEGNAKPH